MKITNVFLKSVKFKSTAFICCVAIMLGINCRKQTGAEVIVYSNNFESGDVTKISNGTIELYNGSHVLGRYNTSNFELKLEDLPKHGLVEISFDLNIHDSWEGNANYGDQASGPDLWEMQIDSVTYINTTFSNLACPVGLLCPPQSYPLTYVATNNPRTGAENVALPGACSLKNSPTGTSLYKVRRVINHDSSTLTLKCTDHLKERFVTDPKCDESWSVDNLQVKLIPI